MTQSRWGILQQQCGTGRNYPRQSRGLTYKFHGGSHRCWRNSRTAVGQTKYPWPFGPDSLVCKYSICSRTHEQPQTVEKRVWQVFPVVVVC